MSKSHILMRKVKFVSLLTIVCLVCFITAVQAFPPLSLPNDVLKFGIREIVPPVKNFCEIFGLTLNKKLSDSGQSIDIQYIPIENEYRGKDFSRFKGLLDEKVQLECGPNSISSEELINPSSSNTANRPFSDWIDFSNPFYETDVRLLLKSDLAVDLANSSSSQLREKLKNLSIGILEGTTTQKQFQGRNLYQEIVTFETNRTNGSNSLEGISSLEQALNALDNGEIQAVASDGIILQAFLREGVQGTDNERRGTVLYRQSRSPYIERGFSIFPRSGSLPELSRERYGIAVRRVISDQLLQAINTTLNDLGYPNLPLAKAQENLRLYEDGEQIFPWDRLFEQSRGDTSVAPTPTTNSTPEPVSEPAVPNANKGVLSDLGFWIIAIFALLVLLALLKYWNRFYAEITSIFGSLRLGGENERTSRDVGITGTNITSSDGGFTAVDKTGQGIDLSKVNARNDIELMLESEQRTFPVVDVEKLTAGRDITIQQFIQDFNVSKPRTLNSQQLGQYYELWKNLLELQFLGNELWDFKDETNLVNFANQLKETRKLVHQHGILFKDSDRQELFSILKAFGEIKVGSKMLREILSRDDTRQSLNEVIITNNPVPPSETIKRIVNVNEEYKFDYEQVVERIRISFKEKLSGNGREV